MNGYLITYTSSERKDITKINYYLFGRISRIKKEGNTDLYYYPGLFEKTPFKKICNGCYFVNDIIDDYDGLLKILPATIDFDDVTMSDVKSYWQEMISKNSLKVKNWEE